MSPSRSRDPGATLLAQSATVLEWLDSLPPADFDRPSVLPEWDVRTLTGHLLMVQQGLLEVLPEGTGERALSAGDYVSRYRPSVAAIIARTLAATGQRSGRELLDALRVVQQQAAAALAAPGPAILAAPRGPIRRDDWILTRLVDWCVHTDDLARTLPDHAPPAIGRDALAATVRFLARALSEQTPGRTVEVRVSPFVAVQAVAGPRHTRGTPPNVVETDALTWMRLATGRVSWAQALAAGDVRASGHRADLAPYLPVMS